MARSLLRAGLPGLLVFIAAIGAILLLTWPWARHFNGEFLAHWDPPFHAWKLEFMARNILRGDLAIVGAEYGLAGGAVEIVTVSGDVGAPAGPPGEGVSTPGNGPT